MGHLIQQGGIQAVGDSLRRQGLIDHIPSHFRPLSHRREDQHPGIEFVGGKVEPGPGIHCQLLFPCLRLTLGFRLFLAVFPTGPALSRFEAGAANAVQRRLQPVFLLLHHLSGKHTVLVHTQLGIREGPVFSLPEIMELPDRMIRGNFQSGRIIGNRRRGFRNLLGYMLLFRQKRFICLLLFFGAEQEG